MSKGDLSALFNLQMMASVANVEEDGSLSNKALVNLFHSIVSVVRPSHFVEIGARQADFSILIGKEFPGTKIFAFEANPYTFEYFKKRRNFEAFGVQYMNVAISDAPGRLVLRIPVDAEEDSLTKGNSSLKERAKDSQKYEECEVMSTSLDAFFPAVEGQTYCSWIDVEGALAEVIAGGKNFLRDCSALFVEVEQKAYWKGQMLAREVIQEMLQLGLVPVARDREYPYQHNVIFIRPEIMDSISSYLQKYLAALRKMK